MGEVEVTDLRPKQRVRKPRARNPQIVMAALQERVNCIPVNDGNSFHLIRIGELLEELNRAMSGKGDDDGE